MVYSAGLDIGSTTAKIALLDEDGRLVFSVYERHHADIYGIAIAFFTRLLQEKGDLSLGLKLTGSAALGASERLGLAFVQEVVAASRLIGDRYPGVRTALDIGGEDAKMIWFHKAQPPDIRMNGSCAGGTGSFIDQMAALLHTTADRLDTLARTSVRTYPVASRCGVFAKTDVQNMLSRQVSHADIAASIFHAVAIQSINAMARGTAIQPKLLVCGGVLTFLPALVSQIRDLLGFSEADIVVPERAELMPAMGAALWDRTPTPPVRVSKLIRRLKTAARGHRPPRDRLPPLFESPGALKKWQAGSSAVQLRQCPVQDYQGPCFLGIDSGSTTTKIAVIGQDRELLYSWYKNNRGNPVAAALAGLKGFEKQVLAGGNTLEIAQSAVTGYGEDLIRAALGIDLGLVETLAHYTAARHVDPDVSFLLDIGGQDMKAVFVRNRIIRRIELNEACSSGCGSFLETLAHSLGLDISRFAARACRSLAPCDLGTRCTVFMNSKIKQSLRENARIDDISAGLAYAVVKNCLFKVLKLHDTAELGNCIVLQGGTFRNPAIVRAMELLVQKKVTHTDQPELMGAFGAALAARQAYAKSPGTVFPGLARLEQAARYTTSAFTCHGCENLCRITRFTFGRGRAFFSGNKCERHFSSKGEKKNRVFDFLAFKTGLLFDPIKPDACRLTLGIPRVLGFYDNFPFWHTLFSRCGIGVHLSPPSTAALMEKGTGTLMSDNICFPAKLVHGHIQALAEARVNRIFMPMVAREPREIKGSLNSFNCPVVTGYADVIQSAVAPLDRFGIPLDRPVIAFDDPILLKKALVRYLKEFQISRPVIETAISAAFRAQDSHRRRIREKAAEIIRTAVDRNQPLIVLAGRPYHADPLVNHRIAGILTGLGAHFITEDGIPPQKEGVSGLQVATQWAWPNRIYNAAQWVARQPAHVQMVQLNSFGCGPDAVVIDEVSEILKSRGKAATLIKMDEIASPGSVRLRLRSMMESLAHAGNTRAAAVQRPPFARFRTRDRNRTIWAPYFSDDYAPYLPAIFKTAGYRFEVLPRPDRASVDLGLQYASNDICYPGTIVVGDIVKALKTRRYHPREVAIGITQTGGQCRASNYLFLIRKAMNRAGFDDIPIISVAASQGMVHQPGFRINWLMKLRHMLVSTLYADAVAKLYYAAAPREKTPGTCQTARQFFIRKAGPAIARSDRARLFRLLGAAVETFNTLIHPGLDRPRMGVVGEIYAKYNYFANQNLVHWLIRQGIEPVLPPILDYFIQDLVNYRINVSSHLRHPKPADLLGRPLAGLVRVYQTRVNQILSGFRHALPFDSIQQTAGKAAEVLSLTHQFGEGWLIPGEIAMFAGHGISHVISVQPFGCIANHIVSKGMAPRISALYPKMRLFHLDFDPGMSEANIRNRLHFMIQDL